jgi:hypothetical protein
MMEPHNFCEPLIAIDLRYEFDEIPETQGIHGKAKYLRGSSSKDIALSGMKTKSKRQTHRRRKC